MCWIITRIFPSCLQQNSISKWCIHASVRSSSLWWSNFQSCWSFEQCNEPYAGFWTLNSIISVLLSLQTTTCLEFQTNREEGIFSLSCREKVNVLSPWVTPIFCPYVVHVLEHHIHHYMMNENKFEIKSKCSTKGIRDRRNREYIIDDILYQEVYKVDLNTGRYNCPYGYWKGISCI